MYTFNFFFIQGHNTDQTNSITMGDRYIFAPTLDKNWLIDLISEKVDDAFLYFIYDVSFLKKKIFWGFK